MMARLRKKETNLKMHHFWKLENELKDKSIVFKSHLWAALHLNISCLLGSVVVGLGMFFFIVIEFGLVSLSAVAALQFLFL